MRLPLRTGFWLTLMLSFFLVSLLAQTTANPVGEVTGALRAGDFKKALEVLQPMLQKSPGSAQLWALQALAYSGEGHKKQALASFQSALRISPDYLPALEGAAQIEYDAGSKAAVPLLERILRVRPDDATSHAMLAVLAYKQGNCALAVQHFEKAGSLARGEPSAAQADGICLAKLKEFDKAIDVFQQALSRDTSNARTRYQLAAVQMMAERPKDTLQTLAPLLEASSPSAESLQLAASAYEATGDTPNAVRTLRQAIVTDPRNVDLYLDFANLSMDHQSFRVGVDMIDSGLKLLPTAAPLYVARGVLYVQLAQYDPAEADFEKANSLDPNASLGSVAQGLQAPN